MEFLMAISGWQWALAASVPAGIVALYFLRLKRKPLQVPSTFLWQKSIEDLHVNSLWQRLRQSILLLLQLLAAAAAILALTRPTIDATKTGDRLIFLIDNSASMAATDGSPTRLDAAKAKAAEIVKQMQPGDAAMVISFNDTAQVVSSYSENPEAVRQAIMRIRQTARRTSLHDAVTIASGLANPQRAGEDDAEAVPATLYVLSDGNFPTTSELSLGNLSLQFLAMGKSSRNVGLMALSTRQSEAYPDRLDVFARVRNFHSEPMEFTAQLLLDDEVVDVQPVSVDALKDEPMVFRLNNIQNATLSVKLEIEDDLAMDNRAWTVVNPPRRARVLVVGNENPVLRAVLATNRLRDLAHVTFRPASYVTETDFATLTAPAVDTPEEQLAEGIFDMVVFDRCAPPRMPDCSTFLIGAVPPALAEVSRTEIQNPIVLNWNSSHPILRFLVLEDLQVADAFTVELPRGATDLLESDKGSLLFSLPRGVFSDVVQTFEIIDDEGVWQTTWPLSPSFPMYMMNVIRTLAGTDSERQQSVAAGDPVEIKLDGLSDQLTVTEPGGQELEVKRTPTGRFTFLDTDQLGIYTATLDERSRHFAVNLFDERESDIQPAQEVQVGAIAARDTSSEYESRRELWKLFALLAFCLLLLEWYVYNRRVYI